MILAGDCIEQMRTLEADSVDAIVTDPPYGLEFMGKEWDGFGTPLGFQTWTEQWAREALRVLKPGGHLLAFGGTRMYHRLAAGIEDAGFEIRDTLMWLYGSGFPKSLDVSKAIDKAAGYQGKVITKGKSWNRPESKDGNAARMNASPGEYDIRELSQAAKKWQGWGTALKPAVEPIVLARKPLIGTVADNVLTHGTGALNIGASRIGDQVITSLLTNNGNKFGDMTTSKVRENHLGRWPANILLDEAAAALLDEQSGVLTSGARSAKQYAVTFTPNEKFSDKYELPALDKSSGGASRFFYVAKASRSERNKGLERNIHPTVKPVDLMRYLIRLVTPKGGTVLDPFLGSGTTAVAAIEEGVAWIGCEREPEYLQIIEARVAAAQPGMGLTLEEGR